MKKEYEMDADRLAAEEEAAQHTMDTLLAGGTPPLLEEYIKQLEVTVIPMLAECGRDRMKLAILAAAISSVHMRSIMALANQTAHADMVSLSSLFADDALIEMFVKMYRKMVILHAKEFMAMQCGNNIEAIEPLFDTLIERKEISHPTGE